MVLRRTLPSRLTGAPLGVAATPNVDVPPVIPAAPEKPTVAAEPSAPSAAAEQAAALAAAMSAVVAAPAPAAPTPPEAPVAAAVPPARPLVDADFAAPVASTGPRVLEDSFAAPTPAGAAKAAPALVLAVDTTPPTTAAPEAAPVTLEAQPAETAPIETATPTTAIVSDVKPEQLQAATLAPPVVATIPQGPTDFLSDNPFAAEGTAPNVVASRPPENPLRRRVPKGNTNPLPPRPKRPEPAAVARNADTPPTDPVGEAVVNPVALAPLVPAAPAASKSAKAPRITTPRNFAAAMVQTAATNASQPSAAPALNLAPEIPVDTRPLDKVDEELIASGIIAGPEADSLLTAVPGSMAVAEEAMPQDFLAPTNTPSAAQDLPSFTLATAPLVSAPSGPNHLLPPAQGGWEVEPAAPTPPPDIFKPMAAQSGVFGGAMPSGFEVSAAPAGTPRVPPPTLPEGRPSRAQLMAAGRPGKSWLGTGVALVALVGVGLFVWNRASAPGGLEAASARIAQLTQPRATTLPSSETTPNNLLPPPTQLANGTGPTGNAQIEFAPPPVDPNAPIVAQGTESMPEDISLFARLQREVQAARAEREGAAAAPTTTTAEAAPSTPLTKEQSDAELAEYRRLLTEGDPATAPKPRQFLKDPDAYMDGQNTQTASLPEGALLPPPATRGESGNRPSTATLPPPNELYTNNPRGLPIVAEPQMQEAPRIRQLGEFAAELFPQDEPRVKVPQGLRPRMAATEFPSLEVLSFVPGKGVIATANGKEGVLMLGETIEGWELTSVSSDMAEFKAGGRSYVLTAQN